MIVYLTKIFLYIRSCPKLATGWLRRSEERRPGFLKAASGGPKKNRQVTYIAPLNRIPLLSSDPGGVLQELAV